MNQTLLTKQLNAWLILPQAERFTELFFSSPSALPATIKSEAPLPIAFTIHNFEGRLTNYHYTVVAAAGNLTQVLGQGNVALDGGESKTVNLTTHMPAMGDRTAIKVKLEYFATAPGDQALKQESQTIQYWVKVSKSGATGK